MFKSMERSLPRGTFERIRRSILHFFAIPSLDQWCSTDRLTVSSLAGTSRVQEEGRSMLFGSLFD